MIWRFLTLLVIAAPPNVMAYVGGSLRTHNHTGPGDGGSLSNLSVSGTLSAGGGITGSSLSITGVATFAALNTTGTVSGSSATFTGPMTAIGSATIQGAVTATSGTFTGALLVVSSASITGAFSANGSSFSVAGGSLSVNGVGGWLQDAVHPARCLTLNGVRNIADKTTVTLTWNGSPNGSNGEDYNEHGTLPFMDNASGKIIIATGGAGGYWLSCRVGWGNNGGMGYATLEIDKNLFGSAASVTSVAMSSSVIVSQETQHIVNAKDNDWFACAGYQNSGGTKDSNAGGIAYNHFCYTKMW